MKDKKLTNILVEQLNRELKKAEQSGSVTDSSRRFLSAEVNPIKGFFTDIDKLIIQVDLGTDLRIEVENISIDWGKVLVIYRFNDFQSKLRAQCKNIG